MVELKYYKDSVLIFGILQCLISKQTGIFFFIVLVHIKYPHKETISVQLISSCLFIRAGFHTT